MTGYSWRPGHKGDSQHMSAICETLEVIHRNSWTTIRNSDIRLRQAVKSDCGAQRNRDGGDDEPGETDARSCPLQGVVSMYVRQPVSMTDL
jgi:hypothetical protein